MSFYGILHSLYPGKAAHMVKNIYLSYLRPKHIKILPSLLLTFITCAFKSEISLISDNWERPHPSPKTQYWPLCRSIIRSTYNFLDSVFVSLFVLATYIGSWSSEHLLTTSTNTPFFPLQLNVRFHVLIMNSKKDVAPSYDPMIQLLESGYGKTVYHVIEVSPR